MNRPFSIKAMQSAALFGIDLDEHERSISQPEIDINNLAASVNPGDILYITGPSGSGKSTLLRKLTASIQAQGAKIINAQRINPENRACIDCFPGPLESALSEIASAGLAEARCFLRSPGELSDGEQTRLRLALALRRAKALDPQPVVIVIDEFAAALDRPTARGVARLLRRGVSATSNTAAITVTSHDDLDAPLQPDQWLHLTHQRIERRSPRQDTELTDEIIIDTGDQSDYRALSRWHYRPGDPAAPVRTLRLRHTTLNETIGALVVAMPTLNSSWRGLAWPERYNTQNKRSNVHRINTEIRRIARVIIDPRFRGLGLAHRLVRSYLNDPITPCTEAAAVMGSVSAFFERAGMTAYRSPQGARHARLLDALEHFGLCPHELSSPTRSWRRICASPMGLRLIERELRRWAGASRSSARHKQDDPLNLWRRACRSITGVPVGYAFTSEN